MRSRAPIIVSSLAALSTAAAPALATDSPAPAALQDAPSTAAIQTALGQCVDQTSPTSGFGAKSASAARRTRVLRGTAGDRGCGVAMVTISIARVHGKHCQVLTSSGRLADPTGCSAARYLMASGTGQWRLKLPKGMPHGSYVVKTRAIDYAANVQAPHTLHLTLG
ncbi:MAG TPA: hypothetical protein VGO71_12675 [Baekduia sp.]|jgi:hypothetical protein|nr:hypothetical protein [Baekduia sp.]